MNAQHRALFLDRDGVINFDHGYVCQRDQFEFVDGIFELCREAAQRGYLIFVVTNQSGIGRGYFTEQQFHELTAWMCGEFLARGVNIAQVYFCPFHAEHGVGRYKRESSFRKPGPGMILQAASEFALDLAGSVLVGDNPTDLAAGVAAGVGCNILYCPPDLPQFPSDGLVVNRLAEVANYLCGECPLQHQRS